MFSRLLGLSILFSALPVLAAPTFKYMDSSGSLSAFIRSNSPHYWGYMRDTADLSSLEVYMKCVGVIAGDPHMGNFAPIPITDKKGNTEMSFVNVDFDDAGIGPLALDFVRYLVTIKASFADIKKRDLENAYLAGLEGREFRPPNEIKEMLDMSVAAYKELADEYMRKRTDRNGFKFEVGEVEEYRGKISREAIEKLFRGEKVIDVAKRPKDIGGSANSLRLWILVEDRDDRRRIMELKEHQQPGLNYYQKQPPPQARVQKVREAFWPGLSADEYKLVEVGDAGFFWLREKKVSLVDVPYSSTKKDKLKFAEELAIYDANQLGLAHARGANVGAYIKAIKSEREVFHDALEAVVNQYLERASAAFKRN